MNEADAVRDRIAGVGTALVQICGDYHYRKIGPESLFDAVKSATAALDDILATWPASGVPQPTPRRRYDSDDDIYYSFQRVHAQLKRLEESGGPLNRQLAALFTYQGRLLEEVEDIKQRLTAQDDRITGIATDLQGMAIDRREGR